MLAFKSRPFCKGLPSRKAKDKLQICLPLKKMADKDGCSVHYKEQYDQGPGSEPLKLQTKIAADEIFIFYFYLKMRLDFFM